MRERRLSRKQKAILRDELRAQLKASDATGLGSRKFLPDQGDRRALGARTERSFREEMAASGWTVTKRGWPDFILRRGKQVIFVEVKTGAKTPLKKDQQDIAILLASAGFDVYRWDPQGGFTRITPPGTVMDGWREKTGTESSTSGAGAKRTAILTQDMAHQRQGQAQAAPAAGPIPPKEPGRRAALWTSLT